ncbi:MAG: hypothetical protein U0Q22_03550 [Acidimicrobiales bacterium]
MELVATVASGRHEAGLLEHVEVLGDGLPRGGELVLGREAGAELEERLAVAVDELVQYGAPSRVGEGLEHVSHALTIGK